MENNDLLLNKLIELENTIDFEGAEYVGDHINIFIILDGLYQLLPFYGKEYLEFKNRFGKCYNIEHYNHKITSKTINNKYLSECKISKVYGTVKSYDDLMLILDQYK